MEAKLQEEGVRLVIIKGKLIDVDGKMRMTDVVDMEQVFRLIQSMPSKKAEPFKLWLAKVGSERFNELMRSQRVDEFIDLAYKEHLGSGEKSAKPDSIPDAPDDRRKILKPVKPLKPGSE